MLEDQKTYTLNEIISVIRLQPQWLPTYLSMHMVRKYVKNGTIRAETRGDGVNKRYYINGKHFNEFVINFKK